MINRCSGGWIVIALVMMAGLAGCAQEVVAVPPRSNMLEEIHVNQTYAMENETEMDPLTDSGAQPTIKLSYRKNNLPPAEAFERVPFPVESPGADSAGWSAVNLEAGTVILVSEADVYSNCRVYIGRIMMGDSQNTHMLLVVPIGESDHPTLGDLQKADGAYLTPMELQIARPTTGASSGP